MDGGVGTIERYPSSPHLPSVGIWSACNNWGDRTPQSVKKKINKCVFMASLFWAKVAA